MYKFLKDWPKNREMGWSEELSGVCHDANNWYFTQNGNLWKFPLSHNLNDSCKSANSKKGILKRAVGYKLGDFDCYNGYLFVPVVDNGRPYIQVYRASDLEPVCRQILTRFGKYYKKINWCAIDPRNGMLFTSDDHLGAEFSSNWSPLMVYAIDLSKIKSGSTEFLTQHKYYDIYDEYGSALTRQYVHGGCFDSYGRLYISNGLYTLKTIDHNFANSKGGISVFKIKDQDDDTDGRGTLCRIAKSNQSNGFKFQFNGTGQEPRGLTYWDLNRKKVAGDLCGQLHVIMIDNAGTGADDFYFKHFDRNASYTYSTRQIVKKKRGLVITSSLNSASWMEKERRDENREMVCDLFRKRGIDYTVLVDPNLKHIDKLIKAVFSGQIDRAYTYINCHGNDGYIALGSDIDILDTDKTKNGVYYIMYYSKLKNIYKDISGQKVFLIESCHSGSADEMLSDNTYILCASLTDMNSVGDSVMGGYATRYWCAGAGSDFIAGAADDLEADSNKDNKVTLSELVSYTNNKLKKWSMPNRCIAYPQSCNVVIFD